MLPSLTPLSPECCKSPNWPSYSALTPSAVYLNTAFKVSLLKSCHIGLLQWKFFVWSTRPLWSASYYPLVLFPPSFYLVIHPPCYSSNTSDRHPPQGLCTYCCPCLECSFPNICFASLFRWCFLSKATFSVRHSVITLLKCSPPGNISHSCYLALSFSP